MNGDTASDWSDNVTKVKRLDTEVKMDCRFCGYSGEKHARACPMVASDRSRSEFTFHCGYRDGRAGTEPRETNAVYRLGWNRGNSALEEAQNGCQSWEG